MFVKKVIVYDLVKNPSRKVNNVRSKKKLFIPFSDLFFIEFFLFNELNHIN